MRYLLRVPNVPAKPRSTSYRVCFFLALESIVKESSHNQHILKSTTVLGISVTVHCFALTMEHLFSPCTRYRDILKSQGQHGPHEWLRELNLDVSTEKLLSAERAFTYADLYAMLGNDDMIVWMTPHTAVVRATRTAACHSLNLQNDHRFSFNVDGKDMYALARSPEHLLEIRDVIVRLLSASVVHSVILQNGISLGRSISATSLALLMEHCQSLKVLALKVLEVDENHCLVIGAYSRPGLEIELKHCRIEGVAADALAEVMGRNQGPTKLDCCVIDNAVLANGLRGNSRLEKFSTLLSNNFEVSNREVLAIADALRENEGLVNLTFNHNDIGMSDESWGAICESLKIHPTLQVLTVFGGFGEPPMAPDVITSRTQALLDMIKVNISIHTMDFQLRYSWHKLFRRSVIPYLETNRFRPRLLAIQKTRPITYRAMVLGRALLSARNDANSFWMLLSGNAEVAFPSGTTTIAEATGLPTPTTAVAATSTSNTNVDAVAASVMSAVTTTATGSLTVATDAATTSAATPSTASASDSGTFASAAAGQKRKARP
jgi:hypothetical protein